MQELTDDQLDGLFRKSSEEFDPPFDPAAWQDLQHRLDAQQPVTTGQTPFRQKLIWWSLPLLLVLLTGSIWYIYQSGAVADSNVSSKTGVSSGRRSGQTGSVRPKPPENQQEQQWVAKLDIPVSEPINRTDRVLTRPAPGRRKGRQPDSQSVNLIRQSEKNGSNPMTAPITRSDLKPETTIASVRQAVGRPDDTARPTPLAAPTTNRWRRTTMRVATLPKRIPRQGKSGGVRQNESVTIETSYAISSLPAFSRQVMTNDVTDDLLKTTTDATGTNANERMLLPTLSQLFVRPGQWPQLSDRISRDVLLPAVAGQPARVQPTRQTGLSVRFVVSPDLSAVGLHNFAKPGTNAGLLLEYRLAPRWSVQAGAIRSTKVYKAATADYTLPAYVANWSVLPESVSGQCRIIDIPVNLRYDVVVRPGPNGQARGRWFVSGGVTTYIMRQEDYTYNYADPTNPHIYPNRRGWTGNTGRYNFSQLNVSAGYEQPLSRRLSWQIEPFVKAPLRGVGYYKINLLSTGAFLSLRYKL